MKTILIGYADREGRVLAEAFDLTEAKQAEIFDAAKRMHRFPKSVLRLDLCTVTPTDTAIFVGEATAKEIAANAEKSARAQTAAAAERSRTAAAESERVNAQKNYAEAARKRNDLKSKVAALKARMESAQELARSAKTKEARESVLEYEKLHDAAVEELKNSEEAFESCRVEREKLNPKTEPMK